MKNWIHVFQIEVADKFQQYDFGTSENLNRYGTSDPPALKLSNIKVPVAMIIGGKDGLADVQTTTYVKSQMNTVVHYEVLKKMSHTCFNSNKNGGYVERCIDIIKKHSTVKS